MEYLWISDSALTFDNYGIYATYNISENKMVYSTGYKNILISDLISLSKGIHKIAEDFIEEKSLSSTTADLILAQYGRINKYSGGTWSVAAGDLPEGFKDIADKAFPLFGKIETIELQNGDILDAPHYWAALNGMIMNNGDLCGWGGDLVQFAKDLLTNPTMVFPGGSFGIQDWNSDADAYNVFKAKTNSIIDGMETYFTEGLNEKVRINSFMTSDNIENRFNKSNNKLYLAGLMVQYGVTNITPAATKMQEYLDKNK